MIALDVGYMDLPELREGMGLQEGKSDQSFETAAQVNFHVTDRFTVTPSAAMQLLDDVTSMVEDLKREGILPSGAE